MQQLGVLLVDDDEDIRFLERNLFESDGRFDVVGEARNGVEASNSRVLSSLKPSSSTC